MSQRDRALDHAKAAIAAALETYAVTSDPPTRATFAALIDAMAGLVEAVALSEIDAMKEIAARLTQPQGTKPL